MLVRQTACPKLDSRKLKLVKQQISCETALKPALGASVWFLLQPKVALSSESARVSGANTFHITVAVSHLEDLVLDLVWA